MEERAYQTYARNERHKNRRGRLVKRLNQHHCNICLEDIMSKDCTLTLACDHIMHTNCYFGWFQSCTELSSMRELITLAAYGAPCPVCRCPAPMAYLCPEIIAGRVEEVPRFTKKKLHLLPIPSAMAIKKNREKSYEEACFSLCHHHQIR